MTSSAEPALSTHTARRTPRSVWLAIGAVLTGVVVFAISTHLRAAPGRIALFDGWLYTGLMLSAAGLVAARAWRVAVERWGWLLIAVGLGCSGLGDVVYVLWVPSGQSPNAADPLNLAFYPLAYAGLVLLMRTRMQRVPTAIRLDALVVGCTLAAAGAALMIGPIAAATSGSLATVLVGLAYPAGDLLLAALAAGMLAIFGWRTEWRWGLVAAGFMVVGCRGHGLPVPDCARLLYRGHLDRHVLVGGIATDGRCQLVAVSDRSVPFDTWPRVVGSAGGLHRCRTGGADCRE